MDTTQKLYLDSVMALAQTLTIKFPAAATMRNEYLSLIGYNVDPSAPSTWAYYMNLAGQYHASDTPMTVVSLDTLETIEFTYDNLLLHRATRKAYAYGTSYYQNLLSRYPNQETLIRGILNPVPMETILSAKSWEILYYDSEHVESQEVYLISDLQEWINNFTNRWYMPLPARVQLQYPATFFGLMFSHLPGEIINIRNRYVRTPQVHSYHLWCYLGSHGRLNKFKDYTSLKQALYLYRNIEYIEAHAGKTSTFVDLIANILTERRIPLTAYELQQDTSSIGEGIYSTGTVAKIPQNTLAESVSGIQYITIEDALENEVDSAKDNADYLETQKSTVPNMVKNAITNILPTKVLESVMVDQSDAMPRKLTDTLLTEWIYLASHGKYTANIILTDPISQEAMSMSVKEALVLWVYAVMQQFEITLTDIPKLTAFFAQRIPSPTFSELRKATQKTYVTELGIQVAMTETTSVSTIISTEAFYSTAVAIQGNLSAHRMMYTSMEDLYQRGEWEVLCRKFYCDEPCTLVDQPTTYATWFKEKNWTLSMSTPQEWSDFALSIFTIATGSDLRSTISISDIHSAMIGIMTQLSSYGVQYVHKTIAAPGIVLDNLAVRYGKVESKGYGKVQLPSRVEVIGQKQKGKSSTVIPSFKAIDLNVKEIYANYYYRLDWGIGLLCDTAIKTIHRIPIAEVRFKGSLTEDITIDVKNTELNGLWLYHVDYRPLDDIIKTLALPGLWVYPPEADDLLQTEVLVRNLDGLWVKKIERDPEIVLGETTLDGIWVRKIPRVQLWQVMPDRLLGFTEPLLLDEFFPTSVLLPFE
ncbi:virion structural protein [Klebsiella phage KpLz-2_45]|uniref:virion structural protein n=1 Tax=Klebsiella phage KpLz-2_45 TaxID=2698923 RepID=UPI001F131FD9|nr:virion structural protein [Klebsiella phage KpLz-2_45]UKS72022.1 virion structural protein [Klebsiella phage KpLz-2_45]